ncbi:aminomethyl-transferring glycine dehydrogenase subunit GcvPA [bacterium]|nr:aminomethyl-transferring glycine dehydrogenase subunit GcvPA [bacterium]
MNYVPLSDKDKKEMLATIGLSSMEDLFRTVPQEIRLKGKLNLPDPLSEPELIQYFEQLAGKNQYQDYVSFLGGGIYPHLIPTVVDYLSSRGEFLTPYTPYQPEVSQGTLQVVFEFQTLISQLTGMEISNASLYDGASGAAEAVLMAHRIKKKPKILVSRSLHPQYRRVIQTYVKNLGLQLKELDYTDSGETDFSQIQEQIDDQTSAVVLQSPNFFGVIENLEKAAQLAHQKEAMFIVAVSEPVSLGMVEAPGKLGADIVIGEGQSLGIPPSFGGPTLGFMACRKEFVRQFPGRISGETRDAEGKRGFVLTLSTREQHIRRERATSNICTNHAWCALRAAVYLETLGEEGMKELAYQNVQKSHYALEKLSQIKGVEPRFKGNVFNEFVLKLDKPWKEIDQSLRDKKIIGGIGMEEFYPELKECALFCVTECHKKDQIDRLVQELEKAL